MTMDYRQIVGRIQRLSDEQHRLYATAARRELGDGQRRRLSEIREELKGLWQERARERRHDPLDVLIEQSYGRAA